ncbi:MAG: hypothetical protein LBB21_06910 [Holosporaceae bacterium]|jgi:hypothetical protein|nr:hypothetical protein [Holosporaceae bacterium]
MCVLIPVLLMAVKYCVDIVTYNHKQIYECEFTRIYKQCAREAALAVAKKWNPGLTLNQQKESLLYVADSVYGSSVSHNGSSPAHRAIPGLEIRDANVESNSTYSPINLSWSSDGYTGVSSTNTRAIYMQGGNQAFYRIMYGNSKDSRFLLKEDGSGNWVSEDMFWDFMADQAHQRYRAAFYTCRTEHVNGLYSNIWGYTLTGPASYKKRIKAYDQIVQVSVENGKIKALTDSDIGYATPAKCNVDIVLAIPANGAACSDFNYDKNTPVIGTEKSIWDSTLVVGTPVAVDFGNWQEMDTSVISSNTVMQTLRATPIYQVAQAFKKFLRDNFEFTLGVNVGLIPYSGKLSIPPHRHAWTQRITQFVAANFLGNQNDYPLYVRNCFLYGTPGLATQSLTASPISSGGDFESDPAVVDATGNTCCQWGKSFEYVLNACPLTSVMCRGPIQVLEGDNFACVGDLLSQEDPGEAMEDSTLITGVPFSRRKFRRMNMYPCRLEYANLWTMKCDVRQNIRHSWVHGSNGANYQSFYLALPYFLVELQADVGKICDLLNVMGPFVDDYNVSNFLFIPIIWANNLFQSWTNDPECKTDADTIGSSDGGHFSRPSKMTKGRKKVLILVVNKPDWFESNELTYLGFDDDFNVVSKIATETIDFSTTVTRSQNGILVFDSSGVNYNTTSGYFECTSGTGILSFSNKYLVKIVVEQKDDEGTGIVKFTNVTNDSGEHEIREQTTFFIEPSKMMANYIQFQMKNIRLISAEITNHPYVINNGVLELDENKTTDAPLWTVPVNAALYNGVGADENNNICSHVYEWQSNLGGVLSCNATTACQKVTTDAIAKLKANYGNNIRIYVIKYRKQAKYKINEIETNFEYDYIDLLATDKDVSEIMKPAYDYGNPYVHGRAYENYVYDADSVEDLDYALQSIADNIKSWAEYEEAKNE